MDTRLPASAPPPVEPGDHRIRALLVADVPEGAPLLEPAHQDAGRAEELTVEPVGGLADALERLAGDGIDVVLVDLGLTDRSGPETIAALREAAPQLPIVVLTGEDAQATALPALGLAAQDHLPKGSLAHAGLPRILRFAIERHRLRRRLEENLWELEASRRELAESETRFQELVEDADDVLYRRSLVPTPRFDYLSPGVTAVAGEGPDRFYADPDLWLRRVHPDDRLAAGSTVPLGPGHTAVVTYRWAHPEKGWVSVEDRRTGVFEDGRLVAYHGIARDTSRHHAAEAALEHDLAQERDAHEQLRAVDEMKTAFLQAVSHELRTPLTVVLGFAHTLLQRDDDLPAELRRTVTERLCRSAEKLDGLLRDLLDIDRLNRGLGGVERRAVPLARLVRAVVENLDRHGHPVTVDVPEDLVAEVDGPKVERIVENLVANAVRHTPDRTPVEVTARATASTVVLSVRDHGHGVPDELVERIWEPFAQGADATSRPSPGTGIGLTLVDRFARLHGGRAWVEAAPGGGATFLVELPWAPSVADPVEDPAPSAVAPGADRFEGVVSSCLQRLLHAQTAEEILDALATTTEQLGGAVVEELPRSASGLSLELSLGGSPPRFAWAVAGSRERALLERYLPRLIEEARAALELRRSATSRTDRSAPRARAHLDQVLGALRPGDLLVLLRPADAGAGLVTFARMLRTRVRAADHCLTLGDGRYLLVVPDPSEQCREGLVERLTSAWARFAKATGELSVSPLEVGSDGGRAALRELLASDASAVAEPSSGPRSFDYLL